MRPVIAVLCMAIFISCIGCSARHVAVDASAAGKARKFLTNLQSMPQNQRAAYIQAHPDDANAVAASGDKNLMIKYGSLLRN